jgi:glycosyltransferase involved in cell wall biosynthesis
VSTSVLNQSPHTPRALGLAAEWQLITGDDAFFTVTKAIHNALQGANRSLSAVERETYLANATRNAHLLDETYDVIVVHDPQPLAIRQFHGRTDARWIGVELDRPLISQVSRFDPWKDPLGVIAAYRPVKQEVPQVQLALVGSMALDGGSPRGRTGGGLSLLRRARG